MKQLEVAAQLTLFFFVRQRRTQLQLRTGKERRSLSSLPLGVTVLKWTVDQDETWYLEHSTKISSFYFGGLCVFINQEWKKHIPSAERRVSLMWNLFMQ